MRWEVKTLGEAIHDRRSAATRSGRNRGFAVTANYGLFRIPGVDNRVSGSTKVEVIFGRNLKTGVSKLE